jgi:hypothetical protein
MAGGLQAHHVRGGMEALPPERDDRLCPQMPQNGGVCLPELVAGFKAHHHLPDTVGADARRHAHEVRRRQIGSERHHGHVGCHQLLLRSRRPAQQRPGETGMSVDSDENIR